MGAAARMLSSDSPLVRPVTQKPMFTVSPTHLRVTLTLSSLCAQLKPSLTHPQGQDFLVSDPHLSLCPARLRRAVGHSTGSPSCLSTGITWGAFKILSQKHKESVAWPGTGGPWGPPGISNHWSYPVICRIIKQRPSL